MNVVINKTPRPVRAREVLRPGRIWNRSRVEPLSIVFDHETYLPDGQIRGGLDPAIPVGRNAAALAPPRSRACTAISSLPLAVMRTTGAPGCSAFACSTKPERPAEA